MAYPESLHFERQPFSKVDTGTRLQVQELYEDAYGARGLWMGDEKYRKLTEPTTTEIATLTIGGTLAAAANLNIDRVGIIATNSQFRRLGLVGVMFEELKNQGVRAWITISIKEKADAMIKAVTSEKPLELINDPEEIESLFLYGTELDKWPRFSFQKGMMHPVISRRLHQYDFTTHTRVSSLHENYPQVVFQVKMDGMS